MDQPSPFADVLRFDAYSATVRNETVRSCAHRLSDLTGAFPCKGRSGGRYDDVVNLDIEGRTAATVAHNSTSGLLLVEAKGHTTPAFVEALRGHFEDHSCPRADVCADFEAPGAFDYLVETIREHKGIRVYGGFDKLPDDADQGKTYAAGKRGGVAYVRAYEAGKHPDRQHLGRPDWARFEVEVRPHYAEDKRHAASMTPVQFCGLASWTLRVATAVIHADVPRYLGRLHVPPTMDRTGDYLAHTFRGWFTAAFEDGIDICRSFEELWAKEDEERRRRGLPPWRPKRTDDAQ